ncbi:hypothetical protein H310_10175 [Aphanomyces invadans]|uniref:DNA 3'-5' helicase n=1 Tax=Aphanomyces invadans TaxID=157072 RepID=A0A024TTI2_9STRA|nr:hypothetical protein H310_10175 [Aphanomyces invadans]ETV96901.1 hypothetical protein H310_10175 [Aphanomyces invadans]|eukprot:XP_008874678.1 hypothetical protein H310_10175 [Aphanomyces invadans]
MTRLEQAQNLATTIAGDEPSRPNLVIVSGTEVCVLGQTVHFQSFLHMIHAIWEKVQDGMKGVLCDFDTSWLRKMMDDHQITDNLNNEEIGHSFVKFAEGRKDLYTHFLTTKKARFVKRETNAGVVWSIEEEYSSYVIRNTNVLARTFYFHHDTIMTIQTYHKGSTKGIPEKPVARFLPKRFAFEFVAYLAIVRPAMSYFAEKRRNRAIAWQFSALWGMAMGKPQTSKALSDLISQAFMEYCFAEVPRVQVVLVSAEVAGSDAFRRSVEVTKSSIHAIIIDEVHLVASSFRNFATAYDDPSRMCVGSSSRMKLLEKAKPINHRIYQHLANFLDKENPETPKGQAIVCCTTIREVVELRDDLADKIITSVFHSQLESKAKAEELSRWVRRDTQVIIATGALGCGVNVPGVTLVLHRGAAYSLDQEKQFAEWLVDLPGGRLFMNFFAIAYAILQEIFKVRFEPHDA